MKRKQKISDAFRDYIKYLLEIRGLSTREASKLIGKSTAYLSQLITGKYKTIDFQTAYSILKNLLPDNDNGDIELTLMHRFQIYSDDYLDKLEEDEIEREIMLKAAGERAKLMLSKASNKIVLDVQDSGYLHLAKLVSEISTLSSFDNNNVISMFSDLVNLVKNDKARFQIIYTFAKMLIYDYRKDSFEHLQIWGNIEDFTTCNEPLKENVESVYKELINKLLEIKTE